MGFFGVVVGIGGLSFFFPVVDSNCVKKKILLVQYLILIV